MWTLKVASTDIEHGLKSVVTSIVIVYYSTQFVSFCGVHTSKLRDRFSILCILLVFVWISLSIFRYALL